VRRRDFIWAVAAASGSWPCLAHAEKPIPVVGILDPDVTFIFDAFVAGMRDLGYVEGQNIAYVRKVAQGKPQSVAVLAAELVDLKVDVIVTVASQWVRAARQATSTIPIVFLAAPDPVSTGLVSSLSKPGGNVTGISWFVSELAEKRVELLHDLIPNLRDVAVFYDPRVSTSLDATEQTGRRLGLKLQATALPSVESFEPAFRDAAAAHVDAVDVLASPFFNANRSLLGELAAKYRLPAIYETGEYVRSGCLIAYGPVFTDMARRGAAYVDRILKGEKPGDLPIERPTKFELAINLKAARALGLAIPASILARADELVE
jgi:putative ABC transport system substrate-binding protein